MVILADACTYAQYMRIQVTFPLFSRSKTGLITTQLT
jgi:hypothetical protein